MIENPKKRKWIMTRLLEDWYGTKDRAGLEVLDHLPGTRAVGPLIEGIVEANMSSEQKNMRTLREKWRDIVGDQIAAVTRPLRVANRVVYAEVSHPAYLRELRGKTIHKVLRDKINHLCGEGFCGEIRFVPEGRG